MKTRGILVVSSVVVLVVLFASYCVFSDHDDQSDGFIILHTNDTHCYYGEKGALGFSTLKALKDQKEAEGNTVFVIDAGDFLATGGDGNEAFVGLDRVVDVDQVQMVISYLEYVGTITQDTIQMGRVVQIERA